MHLAMSGQTTNQHRYSICTGDNHCLNLHCLVMMVVLQCHNCIILTLMHQRNVEQILIGKCTRVLNVPHYIGSSSAMPFTRHVHTYRLAIYCIGMHVYTQTHTHTYTHTCPFTLQVSTHTTSRDWHAETVTGDSCR